MAIDVAEQELGLSPGTLEEALPTDSWQEFADIRRELGWPIQQSQATSGSDVRR